MQPIVRLSEFEMYFSVNMQAFTSIGLNEAVGKTIEGIKSIVSSASSDEDLGNKFYHFGEYRFNRPVNMLQNSTADAYEFTLMNSAGQSKVVMPHRYLKKSVPDKCSAGREYLYYSVKMDENISFNIDITIGAQVELSDIRNITLSVKSNVNGKAEDREVSFSIEYDRVRMLRIVVDYLDSLYSYLSTQEMGIYWVTKPSIHFCNHSLPLYKVVNGREVIQYTISDEEDAPVAFIRVLEEAGINTSTVYIFKRKEPSDGEASTKKAYKLIKEKTIPGIMRGTTDARDSLNYEITTKIIELVNDTQYEVEAEADRQKRERYEKQERVRRIEEDAERRKQEDQLLSKLSTETRGKRKSLFDRMLGR